VNGPDREDRNARVDDPFCELLGVTFADVGDGTATARMPVTPDHLNVVGVLHGGATFALADSAAGTAASTRLGDDSGVAIEANVSFLATVEVGETVTATAEVTHESDRTLEMTVTVETETGERVASYRARGYKF